MYIYYPMIESYKDIVSIPDDTFAFIAGYTSGGFAYGITWEEMEETERRDMKLSGKETNCPIDEEIDLPFD